jgi:ATP-dependent DNA helicase RecG
MKRQELIEKLQDIEWEDFEVKEAKSEVPGSCWESVSAFSNTAGGWLVFGVKKIGKEYEISGVNNPEKISQDFLGVLRNKNKFNKKIQATGKKYEIGGKNILAFYIAPAHPGEKPIYYDNQKNTFIRAGGADQRATPEEIDTFYRTASFEEKDKELTKLEFDDLDKETIRRYRNFFMQVNPVHRYNALNDMEFLEKLSVIKDGKVTFGGLLIFGKDDDLNDLISNYRIEYLEISGTSYEDAPTRYNYRLSSEKNLFLTFFDIYERLIKKIEIPFSIKQSVRDDDPPHLQAIREALVNLIIHTDYFSLQNPRIRIFSDRFEFFNPGGLPKKLDLILKEDFSLPRNPILAKAFRLLRFSENIGSGFHKMIYGWSKKYASKPVIEGDFDYYKITFPLIKSDSTTLTTTKTTTYTTTITKGEDKEREILELLENNPFLSAEEISRQVNLSKEGVRYHLKNLKKKNRIKRKGHGKGGSWQIAK